MFATIQLGNKNEYGEVRSSKNDFPFAYQSLRIETGFRPIGFRYSKSITEISATLNDREILVCGESESHDLGFDKAISELIERSALLSFGHKFGATTSNGWAAHPNVEQARKNAILEIAERDAVLAHWYSKTPFIEVPANEFPLDIQAWVLFELKNSEFPILRLLFSSAGLGPSVTCILMNKDGFGVSAHATKETISGAIASAIAEACRAAHSTLRRSHWKDTMRLKIGEKGRVDPSAHALYYAYHERFPNWMFGKTMAYADVKRNWYLRLNECFEDRHFSFQQVMSHPTNVGFATHPLAFELRWETTNPYLVMSEKGFQRLKLKPEAINGQPHIVS
jgi:hypothetical protein